MFAMRRPTSVSGGSGVGLIAISASRRVRFAITFEMAIAGPRPTLKDAAPTARQPYPLSQSGRFQTAADPARIIDAQATARLQRCVPPHSLIMAGAPQAREGFLSCGLGSRVAPLARRCSAV